MHNMTLPLEFHLHLVPAERDRLRSQGVDLSGMTMLITFKDKHVLDPVWTVGDFPPEEKEFFLNVPPRWSVVVREMTERLGSCRWYDNITFRGQVVSLAVITENPPPR